MIKLRYRAVLVLGEITVAGRRHHEASVATAPIHGTPYEANDLNNGEYSGEDHTSSGRSLP